MVMMNDTVARIVEIMFQDVEMNEETAAIRDEVMNNCQERYSDLVKASMNSDDAIAAVIESLKGMEDVLAPYKKAAQYGEAEDKTTESGEQHMTFESNDIQGIDLHLINEDVHIEASDDENYHVIWDADMSPLINAEKKNGVLLIKRLQEAPKTTGKVGMETGFDEDIANCVRTEAGKIEIDLDSIETVVRNLGNSLKNIFSKANMYIHFGGDGSAVTIRIPRKAAPRVKLLTTSGDIELRDAALSDLNITTTSGDVKVDLNEDQHLNRIDMRTTSGDMNVSVFADELNISSTSGDAEVEGRVNALGISTVSGDINVRADVVRVNFRAVSGDVNLRFDSDEIREVRGSTISGDIEIDLPEGVGGVAIQTQTRSGDVTTRYNSNSVGPTVSGSVTSVSGDITIR